jgi:hypothetical protein
VVEQRPKAGRASQAIVPPLVRILASQRAGVPTSGAAPADSRLDRRWLALLSQLLLQPEVYQSLHFYAALAFLLLDRRE